MDSFFTQSHARGFEKILIIHGKGNHLKGGQEGVLRDLCRRFIESCSFAGESGYSSAKEGGTGSTWVLLKEKT
ncbi:MAG: Smr/MutS family protein [Treponema sp.]|nr:Smr/MutS family protein [Treponema sp.]